MIKYFIKHFEYEATRTNYIQDKCVDDALPLVLQAHDNCP